MIIRKEIECEVYSKFEVFYNIHRMGSVLYAHIAAINCI